MIPSDISHYAHTNADLSHPLNLPHFLSAPSTRADHQLVSSSVDHTVWRPPRRSATASQQTHSLKASKEICCSKGHRSPMRPEANRDTGGKLQTFMPRPVNSRYNEMARGEHKTTADPLVPCVWVEQVSRAGGQCIGWIDKQMHTGEVLNLNVMSTWASDFFILHRIPGVARSIRQGSLKFTRYNGMTAKGIAGTK